MWKSIKSFINNESVLLKYLSFFNDINIFDAISNKSSLLRGGNSIVIKCEKNEGFW